MLDVGLVLQSITASIGIARAVAEAQTEFDRADLKLKMADIMSALADAKIALSEAREHVHERDRKIKELEERISALTSGEMCSLCKVGRLKVIASREHEHFGFAGVQEQTLKCDGCGHSEKRMYDPAGVTKRPGR